MIVKPGQLWACFYDRLFIEHVSRQRRDSYMNCAQTGVYLRKHDLITIVSTNDPGPAPIDTCYHYTVAISAKTTKLVWISSYILDAHFKLEQDV
jgi:hypothetical protein